MENPFRSARLVYRSFETEDEKFLYMLKSDAIAQIQSGADIKPPSKKETAGIVSMIMDKEKSALAVVICLPVNEEIEEGEGKPKENEMKTEKLKDIGWISLGPPRGPGAQYARHGNIGIDILDGYRGQGYGTEAIKWITNWGFMYAGLHRIAIGCISYNEGARRLYERMGFIYEGTKRESVWMNGEWYDLIDFALLDREFKALKSRGNGEKGNF